MSAPRRHLGAGAALSVLVQAAPLVAAGVLSIVIARTIGPSGNGHFALLVTSHWVRSDGRVPWPDRWNHLRSQPPALGRPPGVPDELSRRARPGSCRFSRRSRVFRVNARDCVQRHPDRAGSAGAQFASAGARIFERGCDHARARAVRELCRTGTVPFDDALARRRRVGDSVRADRGCDRAACSGCCWRARRRDPPCPRGSARPGRRQRRLNAARVPLRSPGLGSRICSSRSTTVLTSSFSGALRLLGMSACIRSL